MSQNRSPELLMPAGSYEKLEYAYAFGADACYVGVPLFSLRARENEFDLESLEKAVELRKKLNKKIYFTANIFARNLKLKPFRAHIKKLIDMKPDAFIMSDPGLMMTLKEEAPEIPIHLSVQANCMNWQAVKFWQQQGLERVILSRELRIEEIKEIKDRVPDIELEAFVHGSICIAYSGRCLLSHYMSHRDANQGVCDNSCRYPYKTFKAGTKADEEFYIEDQREPGQFYQIDEDEHGTYIMNSKDLCVIEHLKELKEAGVCSFKVEGRTKSVYYAALVSRIYRQAIDDMMAGRPFNTALLGELDKLANRGYHKGFAAGNPGPEAQNYEFSHSRGREQKFAGIVRDFDSEKKWGLVEVRGRMNAGDEVELISPDGARKTLIQRIQSQKGEDLQTVHPGMGSFWMDLGPSVDKYTLLSQKPITQ